MYLVEVDILPFPCGRYIHHHSAVIILLSIAEASTHRNDLAEKKFNSAGIGYAGEFVLMTWNR